MIEQKIVDEIAAYIIAKGVDSIDFYYKMNDVYVTMEEIEVARKGYLNE